MTDNQQEQATPDEAVRPPVRVPNVSPGAVSGLAHEVIGSAANDAYDAEFGTQDAPQPDTDQTPDPDAVTVPEDRTTTDEQVAWVAEAEDSDTAHARADAVYAKARADDTVTDEALATLSGQLHQAVYGSTPVEGQQATTEAPPGDAENATTGEVTTSGQQLTDTEGQPGETPPTP